MGYTWNGYVEFAIQLDVPEEHAEDGSVMTFRNPLGTRFAVTRNRGFLVRAASISRQAAYRDPRWAQWWRGKARSPSSFCIAGRSLSWTNGWPGCVKPATGCFRALTSSPLP
jgi:hypothetical protein